MKCLAPMFLMLAVLGCGGGNLFEPKTFATKTPIVTESIEIAPLGWRSWAFKLEKDGRINGSYSTASGVDQEIIFYVVESANKDSIEKSQTGSYYFRSLDDRKVRHLTSVSRELPPGNYYLMFHNESKTNPHTANIKMHLEQ